MAQKTAAELIAELRDSLTMEHHFQLYCALTNLLLETNKHSEFWMGWYLSAVQNRQSDVEPERRQEIGAKVLEIGKAVQAQVEDSQKAVADAQAARAAAKSRWSAETIKCCRYRNTPGRNGKACVQIDTNQYCVSCSARS